MNKFIERKNVIIVFLNHTINEYVKEQETVLNEGGVFTPHLRGQVTKLKNALNKIESELPKLAYSQNQVNRVDRALKDVYFSKALKVGSDEVEEYIPRETIVNSLGESGYELLKRYFTLKSGFMYLEDNIKEELMKELIPVFNCFKSIKKFWEQEVLD